MNNYIAIITTVLVITQIIRLVQNTIQIRRQKILFEKQLGQLEDITEEDLQIQKKYYRLQVEYLEGLKEEKTAYWEDMGQNTWLPRWRCSKCMTMKREKTGHCPDCGREMIQYFGKA